MTLSDYYIYAIPTGDYFGKQPDDFYLIYAPLSGNIFLADPHTVEKMNRVVNHIDEDEEIDQLLETLKDTSETQLETIRDLEDYQILYVLPNSTCNFSCSYCFSARGRSTKELSWPQLKATLDYFVNSGRTKKKALKITFAGGGEPAISWKLLKSGIEYASLLAAQQNIKLHFGLITNGSIINEEMLNVFLHYAVRPRISFEILEDVQNKQRGQYNNVCKTIDIMLDKGIQCEIRSMITPDNAGRLEEMVVEMLRRFPAIDTYYFDPITDAGVFSETTCTDNFYKTYNESFIKAVRLAKIYGKEVKNAVLRSLETIVDRYCNGEFCLTPEGTFSICMEVSSPQEKEYERHIYGFVGEDNTVHIDREKFYHLKNKEMAQQNTTCEKCFVRWNCGGGCMANNNKYTKDVLAVICHSTRMLTRMLLLENLKDEYLSQNGEILEETVNNYTNTQ
jgi:radical SAM protein with 4Fe4S-binding SPASM domain